MKKKKTVNYPVETGDAIIVIKEDGRIELCFGEEDLEFPMTWPDQENYKTAVQFALMLDSFIKNGDALDDIILTSPTGNLPGDLLRESEIGNVEISGIGEITGVEEVVNSLPEEASEDTGESEGKEIYSGKVLDITEKLKLKNKEDNDNNK
tara:strand:- start:2058 stop:2510 length:453 start_codon:yes stop_codon:yes gene_type:complete